MKTTVQGYEVYIENSGRMVSWASLGGVAGPMPKEAAENYVKALDDQIGSYAEARIMPNWYYRSFHRRWGGEWFRQVVDCEFCTPRLVGRPR